MDHSSHGGCGGHGGMATSFYFGHDNVELLFSGLRINSAGTMAGACVVVFVLAVLYEALRVGRENLLLFLQRRRRKVKKTVPGGGAADDEEDKTAVGHKMLSLSHMLQTLLHAVQVVASYFLMLVFMSYNGYLCVAVVSGAAAGYLLFGWKRAPVVDVTEYCHC